MTFFSSPPPLTRLTINDRFIWYFKKNNQEIYKVANSDLTLFEEFNKYLINISNISTNYNNFILNKDNINKELLNELLLGFGSSNLLKIFENKQNSLYNNMVTHFVITADENFHLLDNLNDKYFFKSRINFKPFDNKIRLVCINAASTISTQELAKNIAREFSTYHYGNENRFFENDLNIGKSIIETYKNLLFIGNKETTTVYFPSTTTVLDIDLIKDFSEYNNEGRESFVY